MAKKLTCQSWKGTVKQILFTLISSASNFPVIYYNEPACALPSSWNQLNQRPKWNASLVTQGLFLPKQAKMSVMKKGCVSYSYIFQKLTVKLSGQQLQIRLSFPLLLQRYDSNQGGSMYLLSQSFEKMHLNSKAENSLPGPAGETLNSMCSGPQNTDAAVTTRCKLHTCKRQFI